MTTAPYHNAAKLDHVESLAVLDGTSTRHSAATSYDVEDGKHVARDEEQDPPTLALDLSIRRGRLALLTAIAVASIVALTVVFNRGVELERFEARDKNSTQQTKLLDDYNSYTGNVASVFGKPVEIFVTLAVQVIVLRFMVASMLKPEVGWKVGAVTVVLSAGIGYLISNGFNAVNVQLRPQRVQPVISASDLAYTASSNSTTDALAWTHTTSEQTSGNPITNTILREVVTTREPKKQPNCNWGVSSDTGFGVVPDTTLEFGFTQRDWQTRILQKALEPKSMRVAINATSADANKNVSAANFPMNASLAADLFIYGMATARWSLPWRVAGGFVDEDDVAGRYPGQKTKETTATIAGLLPPLKQQASETAQREWFLRQAPSMLGRQMDYSATFQPGPNVAMELSHVDISSSIRFDSLTFEFEVNRTLLGNTTRGDASKRYTSVIRRQNCGPWPGLCMLEKALYNNDNSQLYYDAPVQINAFATCVNADGTETLKSTWREDGSLKDVECNEQSKSSFMILSIGKRLVADAIEQNVSFDASGPTPDSASALMTNVRKIFSVSIGRLSWDATDLSAQFDAKCTSESCKGLSYRLADPTGTSATNNTEQHLVVGQDALPLNLLPVFGLGQTFFTLPPRLMPLVKLNELTRPAPGLADVYRKVAGDPLFLHNVGSIKWDNKIIVSDQSFTQGDTCDAFVEDRLYLAIKNHRYMEQTLQPSYTAATFFLFQNGVVRDAIKLDKTHTSLKFDQNKQEISVWVSVPDQNAWLTLGGCAALIASLGAVLLFSCCKRRHSGAMLANVTEPHVIARVMLDEVQFPPAMLHRNIIGAAGNEKTPHQVDAFVIDGLSLQHQEETKRTK